MNRAVLVKGYRSFIYFASAAVAVDSSHVTIRHHPLCGVDSVHIQIVLMGTHTHTHTRLTAPFPGLPRWAGTRKVKPIWILLKQETVSGSGISWAVCKSAPCSRQTTMPAPHHSVFLQAGCPSCRPTNSVKALKANVNGHMSTMWFMVCHWPQSQEGDWARPHLCCEKRRA